MASLEGSPPLSFEDLLRTKHPLSRSIDNLASPEGNPLLRDEQENGMMLAEHKTKSIIRTQIEHNLPLQSEVRSGLLDLIQ